MNHNPENQLLIIEETNPIILVSVVLTVIGFSAHYLLVIKPLGQIF